MGYILNKSADIAGTSWVADVEVIPTELVRAFGAPRCGSDDYKVTGLYCFVDGHRVYTVYDWKATALYDRRLPSPLAFWNSFNKVSLSIGSNHENAEDVADFKRWLLERVRE